MVTHPGTKHARRYLTPVIGRGIGVRNVNCDIIIRRKKLKVHNNATSTLKFL